MNATSDLNERQQSVVSLARDRGYVTVDELAERLSVTHQTVRRDINLLCEYGILSRFHGGAAYRSSIVNLPYEARRDALNEQKASIARTVANEVADNSSIFIDIGTTAEAVARQLLEKSGMRIVTNNINVANILAQKSDFEIVIAGGTVRNRDLAVVGEFTKEFIGRFQVDLAVLGVVAIAQDGSILDFYIDEEPITQAIINCGRRTFVVADHSKFGRHAIARVAHLSQVDALFSDAELDASWRSRIAKIGVPLMLEDSA